MKRKTVIGLATLALLTMVSPGMSLGPAMANGSAVVGIELDRDSISYGDIAPGETSAMATVGITNTGTLDVEVTLQVQAADADAQDFYDESLYIDGVLYDSNTVIASVLAGQSQDIETQLQVPSYWSDPGSQQATFTFWAEATE